jgi:hypothetical protein
MLALLPAAADRLTFTAAFDTLIFRRHYDFYFIFRHAGYFRYFTPSNAICCCALMLILFFRWFSPGATEHATPSLRLSRHYAEHAAAVADARFIYAGADAFFDAAELMLMPRAAVRCRHRRC